LAIEVERLRLARPATRRVRTRPGTGTVVWPVWTRMSSTESRMSVSSPYWRVRRKSTIFFAASRSEHYRGAPMHPAGTRWSSYCVR